MTAFRLRIALVLVGFCGVLAHWGLGAHYHFQFGGWPEVWRQEFYIFAGTKCLPCSVFLYSLGWAYAGAPYIVAAIGGLLLKSAASIATLILLTVGLTGLNVHWYITANSRDWYQALSPLILAMMACSCCLLAWLVEKASSYNEKSSSRPNVLQAEEKALKR